MRITKDYVFFWGDFLSNFHPCNIHFSGKNFTSSEQAFMWAKAIAFDDFESAELILKAETPKEAKKLGRKVKGFDENKWAEARVCIMEVILIEKFLQNKELQKMLLETGDKILVEASPYDKIWGIGRGVEYPLIENEDFWLGQNLLGKCLMKVREELKNEPN